MILELKTLKKYISLKNTLLALSNKFQVTLEDLTSFSIISHR